MSDWITTEEASELSGYHVVYLRGLIRSKKIEAQKKGGSFWVKRDSLLAYMKEAEASQDKRHGSKRKPNSK
jgi:excisionase family DNA binding protein